MYIPTSALLSLVFSLSLASAHAPIPNPPHRRHLARQGVPMVHRAVAPPPVVLARAGAPISNETLESISEAAAYSSTHPSTVAVPSATTTSSAASQSDTTDDDTVSSIAQTSAASTAAASVIPVSSVDTSSEDTETSVSTLPSVAPVVSAAPSSADTAPSTIAQQITSTVPSTAKVSLVTTVKTTASSTASAAASKNSKEEKSGGLSKTALIAIIVVASVVGAAAIGWTIFRKWKLKPSNRFDERMKPIDFSPHNDGMAPDFLEKTLHRTASNASADRQRQQFVAELDVPNPNLVPGIPEHDFTAGSNQAGYGTYDTDAYHADPFAHTQAYEYDQGYYGQEHAYPPAPMHGHNGQEYAYEHQPHGSGEYSAHGGEYPTQDPEEGYADLQRGNSNGSNHGQSRQQVYPTEFPTPETYIGRPTGGSDGPYAQAAQYRGY